MTVRFIEYDELWGPWVIHEQRRSSYDKEVDLPEELIMRFEVAKVELSQIWDELAKLIHSAEGGR